MTSCKLRHHHLFSYQSAIISRRNWILQLTAKVLQCNTRLRRHTINADDAYEASDQERGSNLYLLPRLHLQAAEHEHGQTHGDNIGDCVEASHDLEFEVQLNASFFDVWPPCALDWMALEEDDKSLDEAVGADEDSDTPEYSAEALIWEDAVVEDECGNLDA